MGEKIFNVKVASVHDQGLTGEILLIGVDENRAIVEKTIDLAVSRSTHERLLSTLVLACMLGKELESVTIEGGSVKCVKA